MCGGEHCTFGNLTERPQRGKCFGRGKVGCFPSCEKAVVIVGGQGGDAGQEGIDIHVFMAPGVFAIDEPRLWRRADLREQRTAGQRGDTGTVIFQKGSAEDFLCFCLQFTDGMCSASGAFLGGPAADEASSRLGSIQFSSVRGQDIQIKQPADRKTVFQAAGDRF